MEKAGHVVGTVKCFGLNSAYFVKDDNVRKAWSEQFRVNESLLSLTLELSKEVESLKNELEKLKMCNCRS